MTILLLNVYGVLAGVSEGILLSFRHALRRRGHEARRSAEYRASTTPSGTGRSVPSGSGAALTARAATPLWGPPACIRDASPRAPGRSSCSRRVPTGRGEEPFIASPRSVAPWRSASRRMVRPIFAVRRSSIPASALSSRGSCSRRSRRSSPRGDWCRRRGSMSSCARFETIYGEIAIR